MTAGQANAAFRQSGAAPAAWTTRPSVVVILDEETLAASGSGYTKDKEGIYAIDFFFQTFPIRENNDKQHPLKTHRGVILLFLEGEGKFSFLLGNL